MKELEIQCNWDQFDVFLIFNGDFGQVMPDEKPKDKKVEFPDGVQEIHERLYKKHRLTMSSYVKFRRLTSLQERNNYFKKNGMAHLIKTQIYEAIKIIITKYPSFAKRHLFFKKYRHKTNSYKKPDSMIPTIYALSVTNELKSFMLERFKFQKSTIDYINYMMCETEINKQMKIEQVDELYQKVMTHKPIV